MSTPAGWYDDGSGAQRYWDGDAWTGHVAHAAPGARAFAAVPSPYVGADPYSAAPTQAGAPGKSRVGLGIGIAVAVCVLLGGLTVAVIPIVAKQTATASPRSAFDDILDAWKAKDCPAEYRLSYASTTATTEAEFCKDVDYDWVDAYEGWDVEVTNVDQTLGTATIATFETYTDGETGDKAWERWTYTFDRVDGEWYYVTSELVD